MQAMEQFQTNLSESDDESEKATASVSRPANNSTREIACAESA